MITDAARTVLVESNDHAKKSLLILLEYALNAGINVVKAGVRTGDIGYAIQKSLENKGLGCC